MKGNIKDVYIKKDIIFILLCALFCLYIVVFSDNNENVTVSKAIESPLYSGGNGTQQNPYKISSKEDMFALSNFVQQNGDTSGLYYEMTNSIDLENEEFVPIGRHSQVNPPGQYFENEFKGYFNGNYFYITNLQIKNENLTIRDDYGLFGRTNGAEIKNIVLLEGKILLETIYSLSSSKIGGVVGYAEDTKITNCFNNNVSIEVSGHDNTIGGVVGYAVGKTAIDLCYNSSSLKYSESDIRECDLGGVVGDVGRSAFVTRCFNIGTISLSSLNNSNIIFNIGGIVGYLSGEIKCCYNLTNIKFYVNNSHVYIGGLVGCLEDGKIKSSYNAGEVFGVFAGGIVGSVPITYQNLSEIKNCYFYNWINPTTGRHTVVSGTNYSNKFDAIPLTLEEMKSQDLANSLYNNATYYDRTGWSYSSIINNGFPYLNDLIW